MRFGSESRQNSAVRQLSGEMKMRILVSAAVFLAALLGSAEAQERAVPQSAAQVQLSFAPVVSKVAPAVVNVYSRRVVRQAVNPFFQQFFGGSPMRSRVEQSLGSGVIVRSEGIIVTNNHVIEGGQDIQVALPDRREFEAKVILADPRTDLAVLRIDTKGERLPALQFGDSDKLQVGDLVLAIGDPFGVGQTVTSGIVSALARSTGGASDYQFFIQTDAAINPGNSGGALVTLDGRLIGINTSIYSQSGGNVGIGFAIPSNMTRVVVDGALGGGIKRPWLGADGQGVTSEIAKSLGLARPEGVVLSQVYPGGPAAQAGLVKGDVLVSVDGFTVTDSNALRYRVVTHRPGDTAAIRYWRNGAMRDASIRIALPPDAGREEGVIAGANPMQGARVANLTPALADEMQMDMMARGVVVTGVAGNSQAARFGFREGDIVRQINGERIASVAQLRRALTGSDEWQMAIQRGDQVLQLAVQ
jgi:Do/DeqQ family serine protease